MPNERAKMGQGAGPVHKSTPTRTSGSNVGVKGTTGLSAPVGPIKSPGPVSPSRHRVGEEAHQFSDVDSDLDSLHHTLGKGTYQAAPGKDTDDRLKELEKSNIRVGVITAIAPFSLGTFSLVRQGDLVTLYAEIIRLVGFSTSYTDAFDIPEGFRPPAPMTWNTGQFAFTGGVYYQIAYDGAGRFEERMSAANANSAFVNGFWRTTDAMPDA
jgi:hypothetical protein